MRKLTLIFAVLLCVANILTAQEINGKPTVVTLPFDAKSVEQSEAEVLLEVLTNEIAGTGKVTIVDRSKIDKIKKEHEFQNSDWSNNEKVAKLGNVLNANAVITGQLMLFKKDIVATFRMLDVNTMEIVSSATTRVKDTSEFFDKIPEIAKTLMGEIKSISTTSNITTSKPESSSVSTNVSTPKTRSTSSTSNISIPRTSNFSTSSTSKTTTTYGKTYNIGDDGPGGGIIFYHSEVGFDVYEPDGSVKKCHYLEVSKFDLGKISWCTQKSYTYSCNITTLPDVGAGRINTFKIIKSSHKGGTITKENCAALACHSYSTATTKAGDWFLPSKDELNLLYQNLGKRVLLSNTTNDNYYWSSSQDDYYKSAWVQSFSDGLQDGDYKFNTFSVRAVRAF
ncbi:MAG: DUF1566 domain-containing protein [Spirochaetales bacterium]|nr:DUF1566 domain-containing protein [Spirochaetales bacterium]